MTSYGYEAIGKNGETVKGSLEAENLELARTALTSQGLLVINIKEQSIFTKDINLEIGGYPTARDLSVFCRQFVSMTRSGVTILECLKLLEEQTENKRLKEATSNVRVNVEKGETLSNSLRLYPKIFPELMINMVTAGEASGSLDVALERMSVQFEKTAKTKAMVKKAMIYPVIVCIVALIVIVIMLVFVIPRYSAMFGELGVDLPGITLSVMAASDFIIGNWFILLPVLVAVILGLSAWGKTDSGKHFFHKIKLGLPIVKGLEIKQASSLMARTLSTLLAAGVPLIEAVEISTRVLENVYFREAMEMCHEELVIGQPLSNPLEESGLFPPMVYHMVRIGEESGNVEDMLSKTADYYDEEVEMAVQSLMAAMEPLIIIILAVVVGGLVAACLAPMLKMYSALGNL